MDLVPDEDRANLKKYHNKFTQIAVVQVELLVDLSIDDLGIYCFCPILGPSRGPLWLAVYSRARYQRSCYYDFLLRVRSQIPKARLLHFLRVRLGIHGEHLLGVLAKQGLYLHDSFLGRDWRAFHLSLDDISTSIRINFRCGLSSSWAHVCDWQNPLAGLRTCGKAKSPAARYG